MVSGVTAVSMVILAIKETAPKRQAIYMKLVDSAKVSSPDDIA
jgi:hypothetical protein